MSIPPPRDPVYLTFSRQLRRWFSRNGRDLPWRQTRDPYRVLVSELMLQQTQVARVVGKYQEFLETFPTLQHVAEAPATAVVEAWEGLGYYARARNLHKLAQTLRDGAPHDTFPSAPEQLRRLPGIGAYTAGAVASFAFERRAPLVDTNVARVLRRVFAPRADFTTATGRKTLWTIAERALPRTGKASWTHNQAVMELGALVCTARVQHCHRCPVAKMCATFRRTPRAEKPRKTPPARADGNLSTPATIKTRTRRQRSLAGTGTSIPVSDHHSQESIA